MIRTFRWMLCLGLVLALPINAPAGIDRAEITRPALPAIADAEPAEPLPPAEDAWAGVVVIAILSLVAAAACIGPIVRTESPQGIHPPPSRQEPPAQA